MADVSNGGDDERGSASILQVVRYLVQTGYLEICFVERVERGCKVQVSSDGNC